MPTGNDVQRCRVADEELVSYLTCLLTSVPWFVESCWLVLRVEVGHNSGPGACGSACMRPVTIHSVAGSTFELRVDEAETGLDVRRRVAGSVGLAAASIVLTSGGRVLELDRPLLRQTQTHSLTQLNGGRVKVCLAEHSALGT